jgi:hypothetical protein
MRKAVLGIMAAGSVFALTAAGATGITLTGSSQQVNVQSNAEVSVQTSVCQGTPVLSYAGVDTGAITGVSITGLTCTTPADNFHYVFAVALNDGETTVSSGALGVATEVLPGATTTINASSEPTALTAFNLSTHVLTNVDLTITEASNQT